MDKAEWLASREPPALLEIQLEAARLAYRRQPSQANADRCELLWNAVEVQRKRERGE